MSGHAAVMSCLVTLPTELRSIAPTRLALVSLKRAAKVCFCERHDGFTGDILEREFYMPLKFLFNCEKPFGKMDPVSRYCLEANFSCV